MGGVDMTAWLLMSVVLMVFAGARPAAAQVMEIGDDGSVSQIGAGWRDGTKSAPAPARHRFRAEIEAAAQANGLSPEFLEAVALSESGLDPDAVSPAGAIGLMQLMPGTARELGVDPQNPAQNLMGGARYLRAQLDRFGGSIDLALAAYNAGSGQVVRHHGLPPFPETRAYVSRNLDRLARAADAQSQGSPQ